MSTEAYSFCRPISIRRRGLPGRSIMVVTDTHYDLRLSSHSRVRDPTSLLAGVCSCAGHLRRRDQQDCFRLAAVLRCRSWFSPTSTIELGGGNHEASNPVGAAVFRRVSGFAGASRFGAAPARTDRRESHPPDGGIGKAAAFVPGGSNRQLVAGTVTVLRREARAHLDLLASRTTHRAPSDSAHCLFASAGQKGAIHLRADR